MPQGTGTSRATAAQRQSQHKRATSDSRSAIEENERDDAKKVTGGRGLTDDADDSGDEVRTAARVSADQKRIHRQKQERQGIDDEEHEVEGADEEETPEVATEAPMEKQSLPLKQKASVTPAQAAMYRKLEPHEVTKDTFTFHQLAASYSFADMEALLQSWQETFAFAQYRRLRQPLGPLLALAHNDHVRSTDGIGMMRHAWGTTDIDASPNADRELFWTPLAWVNDLKEDFARLSPSERMGVMGAADGTLWKDAKQECITLLVRAYCEDKSKDSDQVVFDLTLPGSSLKDLKAPEKLFLLLVFEDMMVLTAVSDLVRTTRLDKTRGPLLSISDKTRQQNGYVGVQLIYRKNSSDCRDWAKAKAINKPGVKLAEALRAKLFEMSLDNLMTPWSDVYDRLVPGD